MDGSRYIVNITATVSGSGSVKLWVTVSYGGGKDMSKTITLTGSTGQLTRTVTFDRKTLCPSAEHGVTLVVQPYPGGDPAAFDQASC
ncbi:hypothetical protein ACFQY4_35745 [Catellatospora bangladeshensis]|uniref:hypothetical protein n=1 Tax=Catellatospora bangladeshensis TaxID=310355 RepID=UPI003611002B